MEGSLLKQGQCIAAWRGRWCSSASSPAAGRRQSDALQNSVEQRSCVPAICIGGPRRSALRSCLGNPWLGHPLQCRDWLGHSSALRRRGYVRLWQSKVPRGGGRVRCCTANHRADGVLCGDAVRTHRMTEYSAGSVQTCTASRRDGRVLRGTAPRRHCAARHDLARAPVAFLPLALLAGGQGLLTTQ